MSKPRNFAFFPIALTMLSIISQPVFAQVRFKPPSTKPPVVTRPGGSRGECVDKTQQGLRFVKGLIPKNNFGLTTSANPTLMVYIPKSTATNLTLELRSEDKKQILLQQNYPVPANASVIPMSLSGTKGSELKVNQNYYWKVTLICPSRDRDSGANSVAQGWIQRIQPDAQIQDAILQAAPQNLPSVYAEAGIWFDALMSLDALRQQQPRNRLITANWNSLLRSGQIEEAIISLSNIK